MIMMFLLPILFIVCHNCENYKKNVCSLKESGLVQYLDMFPVEPIEFLKMNPGIFHSDEKELS